MKRVVLSVFAFAALGFALPAAAQVKSAEVRATAACVVISAPGETRRLLATLPGSEAELRVNRSLSDYYGACSNHQAAAIGGRASLAVALVEKQVASGAPNLSGAADASPWYVSATTGRTAGKDYDADAIGTQAFGACVIKAVPDASARLFATAPGSAEERAAIEALKPALGPCIPQGTPMRLSPAGLRMALAEPLYHLIAK